MDTTIPAMIFAPTLFLGMVFFLEIGRRMGVRRMSKQPAGDQASFGTLEGSIFALFGLLVAFTFSGAASRFDSRRELIADKADAIETAYLRLDSAAPESRSGLRELFRKYVDSRLEVYRRRRTCRQLRPNLADLMKFKASSGPRP